MITTIAKLSRKLKKKEWTIYHNIGAQQDAERFSLIDSVLDEEYNDLNKAKKEENTFSGSNLMTRFWKRLRTILSHNT